MARTGWDRPDEHDHVLLLVTADDDRRRLIRGHLALVPGSAQARTLGRYPRFRLIAVRAVADALRRATPRVTVAAVDLVMPRRDGLEVIHELRARRRDLAILAFTPGAPSSEAVAALLAGADFFHDCRDVPDPGGFERSLELAIERRRLARLVEQSEADAAEARARLAQLSDDVASGLSGLRPSVARQDVLPFKEAVRRYLTASARLFEGDTRGLGRALGVSYFALRRLFARYQVPLPSRSRKQGTGGS